ncbi:MAG: hypothetical protein HY508_06620 [Acidobacteria bacterium]|nr:hypothetical protein [Acidobacteriota bacterium]
MVGNFLPRVRHSEHLAFLEKVERPTPCRGEMQLIGDKRGRHTRHQVQVRSAAHPRYHLHVTPTGTSVPNLVERRFVETNRRRIRSRTFQSIA